MFQAWQRSRAKQGTHWLEELYGVRPKFITALIARITYELMIEQQRQEQLEQARAQKQFLNPDAMLNARQPAVYRWLRSGKIGIRF